METESVKQPLLKFFLPIGLVCGLIFSASGCVSAQRKAHGPVQSEPKSSASSEDKNQTVFGPPGPSDPAAQAPHYGPDPVQVRPVVLVLGPGLARAYTYLGIFRALQENKIPVGAVLGTEMGGFMAALYGMSANLNQFEWSLFKFKEAFSSKGEGFLSRIRGDQEFRTGKLEKSLREVFSDADLRGSRVPVRVAIQAKETGIPIVVSEGNAAQAVRSAVAAPGFFPPNLWKSTEQEFEVVSAAGSRPFLVQEARNLNLGPVLVVNVLSDSEAAVATEELKGAHLVLRPDVSGIGYRDFEKRTDAALRGKTAVLQHLSEIREMVGLPPKPENSIDPNVSNKNDVK